MSRPRKWKLEVWEPGGAPRYRDVLDAKGRRTGGTEVVGRLFRREYGTEAATNRAIPNLRRMYPGKKIERTQYVQAGPFWMATGVAEEV